MGIRGGVFFQKQLVHCEILKWRSEKVRIFLISVFIRILEDSTVKEYHWESLCMIESMEEAL